MTPNGPMAEIDSRSVTSCPLCGGTVPQPFLRLHGVPVLCNVLYASEAAARSAPLSDIELVCCPKCALVYNAAFKSTLVEYSPLYENPLEVSAVFRDFAEDLSRRLVTEYDLRDRTVVEIGCGNGFFLERLIDNGMRSAVGYDPSMKGRPVPRHAGTCLRIVPELFEAIGLTGQVDAIICRHVLEHLANPALFLAAVRDAINSQTPIVYFEVPNAEWVLSSMSLGDVIYEHFTYWTRSTFKALFTRSGFMPISIATGFGNQFLMIEARPSSPLVPTEWPSREEVDRLVALCNRFAKAWNEITTFDRRGLHQLKASGQIVVLWGAGSKGVTIANLIGMSEPLLAGIVDVNPSKQSKYVGGCALRVLAPDELRTLRPDTVLLMNENYREEVKTRLDQLGLAPDIRLAGLSP